MSVQSDPPPSGCSGIGGRASYFEYNTGKEGNEGRCLTQRDVEQRFQLRGATLSRLFQRMEAAGLLERRAVSRDQRCKQLLPTEKARAMHAQFVTCLDETDRLLLQGIRPEDEAVFRSVCLQMLNNLTQQDAAGPAAH